MSKAEPSQTPLVDLARSVPKDIRVEWEIQWSEDGTPTGHSMAPVGLYLHELAERVESLTAENVGLKSLRETEATLMDAAKAYIEIITAELDALKAESDMWCSRAIAMFYRGNVDHLTGAEVRASVEKVRLWFAEPQEQQDHTQNHLCMSEEDSEIHEFRDRLNRAKEAASEGDYEKAAAIMWDDYECTKFDTFSQSSQSSEDPQ